MAESSGSLEFGESWKIGNYSVTVEKDEIPDTESISYTAKCNNTAKTVSMATNHDTWYAESDGSTINVYVGGNDIGEFEHSSSGTATGTITTDEVFTNTYSAPQLTIFFNEGYLAASKNSGDSLTIHHGYNDTTTVHPLSSEEEIDGKIVYYVYIPSNWKEMKSCSPQAELVAEIPEMAWAMVYKTSYGGTHIATFSISGSGGGGDWDYGDITATLYVTVKGAHSGRHTDALADALDDASSSEYLYQASENTVQVGYGSGGDGGHGGGGGAGASTVVIHSFGTWRAHQKDLKAYARGHGYGGGGGEGAAGGDGIILIYY